MSEHMHTPGSTFITIRKGHTGKRYVKRDVDTLNRHPSLNNPRIQTGRSDRETYTDVRRRRILEADRTVSGAISLPSVDNTSRTVEHDHIPQVVNSRFGAHTIADLQQQREYLLESLQKADHQATRLVRQLVHTQAKLDHSSLRDQSVSHLKRQCCKLGQRLKHCESTERGILDELGRVSWQIQATGRWIGAEQYRSTGTAEHGILQATQDLQTMALDPQITVFQPQGWDDVPYCRPWIPEQNSPQVCGNDWVYPIYPPFYHPTYDYFNHQNHHYTHEMPFEQVYYPILPTVPEDLSSSQGLTDADPESLHTPDTYHDLLKQNKPPLERVRTRSLPTDSGRSASHGAENCAYAGYGYLNQQLKRQST